MLHTKKISLIILLILIGFSIYKYSYLQKSYYSQKKQRKATNSVMKTTPTTINEITTPSGLRYTILQSGPDNAQQAKSGNTVTVHYTGFLEENGNPGKKFDSSVDRGTPFNFIIDVGMVIKGWDEGVKGMLVGEKRRLIIPAKLGYGARGVPNTIPANATLIFDVELLAIK